MKVKISSLKKKLNESIRLWPGPGSFGSSKSKKSIPLSLSSVSLAGSVFRDELLESSQSSQNNFRGDKQSNEAADKQMIETNSQSFTNSMASVRSSSSKSSSYSSSSYSSSSSSSSGCSSAASSCLSSTSTSTSSSSSSSTEMIEMLMISDENKRNETSFRSSSLSSPTLEATLSAASSGYSCNFFGKRLSAATTKLRYVDDDDDEPNSCGSSETDDNDRNDHQNENEEEEDEELDDENERTLFISKSKSAQMLRRTTIILTRN